MSLLHVVSMYSMFVPEAIKISYFVFPVLLFPGSCVPKHSVPGSYDIDSQTHIASNWNICKLAHTVYPNKYAHGFCFAVLCCGYTLTNFPISIRLTSLALWQSNDCPSASKATLVNMDKYFM